MYVADVHMKPYQELKLPTYVLPTYLNLCIWIICVYIQLSTFYC